MKKNILHYIKITLALVLFLQVGEVSAQTIIATNVSPAASSVVPTGWTMLVPSTDISNKTGWAGSLSPSNVWGGTVSNPPNGHTVWVSGYANESCGTVISGLTIGKKYVFTFYVAELQVTSGFQGAYVSGFDGVFEVGSYTVTPSAFTSLATYPFTGGNSNAWSTKTLTFTATATTLPVGFRYQNAPFANGNVWNVSFDANAVAPLCAAGTTAPTLSATTINNNCTTSPYINLNSLVTSTLPTGGASLVWYTNNTRTGSPVLDPTKVGAAGTYYAFYYDATNDCYGPASAAVVATYTPCKVIVPATVCPTASVDLATRVTDTAPAGYTYTYHSGTPATTANKLPSSVVTTSGDYYVGTFSTGSSCYSATSRPINVTITNCCSSVAPPTFN